MDAAEGERIFVLVRDANDEAIASLSQSAKTTRLGAYPFAANGGFRIIIVATMI
jgi:hypothetical protein